MKDERLDRVYDYTKFHIGIYLGAAGALVTLIGAAANESTKLCFANLIGWRLGLVVSFVTMVAAGIAGGIIASSSTECEKCDELWDMKQGAFGVKLLKGKHWARLEHGAFWLSLIVLAYSILRAPTVWEWVAGKESATTHPSAVSASHLAGKS